MNFYYDWNALNQAQSNHGSSNGGVQSSNQRNSFQNPYEFIPTEQKQLNASPYLNWTSFNAQQAQTQQQTQPQSAYSSNLQLQQQQQSATGRLPLSTPIPQPPSAPTPIPFNQSQLWNEQVNAQGNPQEQQSFYSSG